MKNLRSLLNEPKRLRRLVLLWIPLVSLLWGGCDYVNKSFQEEGYCWNLRYSLLPEYYEKHHRWPVNIGEIESDELARANQAGRWRVRCFYYESLPSMTVLNVDRTSLLIRVQFTGGNQGSDRVHSDVDDGPGATK